MQVSEFKNNILSHFGFTPTSKQNELLDLLSAFVLDNDQHTIFVLKGYAGTGKTSVISALVKTLQQYNYSSVLLAPTGRAAKVISGYSQQPAYTIHRKIYYKKGGSDGDWGFSLAPNKHKNTLFIVDEASMISDSGSLLSSNSRSLLDDLIQYVYNGQNCRLILVGDTAQLPPVGMDISPALNIQYLQASFPYHIITFELTEVVRQTENSGILSNATIIRTLITHNQIQTPKFNFRSFKDVHNISGQELEDTINSCYSKYGEDGTLVVCYSNKRANAYNQQIRNRIKWQENELSAGDLVMAVKNNYFWLPEESKAGFIANGEILEILKVKNVHEMYGFKFADTTLRLTDYENEKEIEARVLLNTLSSESPALTTEQNKQLFEQVMADYMDEPSKGKRFQKLKADPYYNALQIKFSYAVTCHKAQGGQWDAVIIEQPFLGEKGIDLSYLRWLYTAFTRPTKELFLVNFKEEYFN